MDKTENFVEAIHKENYEESFAEKPITYRDMIYDSGREKESLNGFWNFQIDMYDTCLRAKWYEEKYFDDNGRCLPVDYNFEQWDKIHVPSCWNLQDARYFYYEGPAVYTRTFRYSGKRGERVFLKFGAANYEAKIFLNKEYLGFHRGGSTPFNIEVTGKLKDSNRILVVADNTRKTVSVPCKNTDWFNYGGLYRDVELIRLPETFIKDFHIRLVSDGSFSKIKTEITTDGIENNGEALLDIDELNIHERIKVADGYGESVMEASPELWSFENPKLYDVRLSYINDAVNERIGFREIKTQGRDIYLNGKKIFLKGVCMHEESVANGKSPTDAEIIESFRLAREMNCNFVRLAHYPHKEKAARIADVMGIMLWEEIPVYWAIDFENKETYKDAENQLAELILRDRNRCSVIIWSVGNENEDTDSRLAFMSSLAARAKELDPARLVSAACLVDEVNLKINDRLANHLDIIGINEYYGWYDPDFSKLSKMLSNSKPDKPVVITEFGADARAGARGTVNDLGTEDCQLAIYKKQVEMLDKIPYVKGTSPWIFFDFRCPRRTNELQRGYNTKGLLSADKKYKKPAFYVMQEYYSKLT